MNDYDVAVVGGRVAGASTALLLARAGLRVAVIERSRPGTDTVSTHALMRAGVLQLSRWGVLPDLVAAGTPEICCTTFHYADGGNARVSVRRTPGVDALYAPRRTLLDRVLLEAAAAAGADVHHDVSVVGLLRGEDGRVEGVSMRDRLGRRTPVRAGLTVGADGIGSLVAREAGATIVHRGRGASALLYRYVADVPDDGYVWAYGNGVGSGLIPTNDGLTCAFVGTTPVRMTALRKSGADAAYDELLGAAGPDVAEIVRSGRPVERLHGWHGVPGYVRTAFGPGWALVGDAGYFRDPISTHGMTDALRDAELLADAVVAVHAGVPEQVALAAYQETRDRLSHALFSVTDEVARYDWSAEEIRVLLRRMSSAMSDEVDHLTGRADADLDRA